MRPTPLIHGPTMNTPDSKGPATKQRITGKKVAEGNVGEGSYYGDKIAYLAKLVGRLTNRDTPPKPRKKRKAGIWVIRTSFT